MSEGVIVSENQRWSGYSTQSKAWQQGYDWERGQGPHADLDIFEAMEACGYDLDAPEADDFEKGAEFAQGDAAHD